jgi:hypothetical protein
MGLVISRGNKLIKGFTQFDSNFDINVGRVALWGNFDVNVGRTAYDA